MKQRLERKAFGELWQTFSPPASIFYIKSMLKAWAPQWNGRINILQLNDPLNIFTAASHTCTNRSIMQQAKASNPTLMCICRCNLTAKTIHLYLYIYSIMYFMFVVFYLHSDKNIDFTVNMCKASSSKNCIIPSRSTNTLVIFITKTNVFLQMLERKWKMEKTLLINWKKRSSVEETPIEPYLNFTSRVGEKKSDDRT